MFGETPLRHVHDDSAGCLPGGQFHLTDSITAQTPALFPELRPTKTIEGATKLVLALTLRKQVVLEAASSAWQLSMSRAGFDGDLTQLRRRACIGHICEPGSLGHCTALVKSKISEVAIAKEDRDYDVLTGQCDVSCCVWRECNCRRTDTAPRWKDAERRSERSVVFW
jgi:hypothetical protein